MKTADEILDAATIDRTKPLRQTITELIESAQREAWNEAIEEAAKTAEGLNNFAVAKLIRSLHREEE